MNADQMRRRAEQIERAALFLESTGGKVNLAAATRYREQARELRAAAEKHEKQKREVA